MTTRNSVALYVDRQCPVNFHHINTNIHILRYFRSDFIKFLIYYIHLDW